MVIISEFTVKSFRIETLFPLETMNRDIDMTHFRSLTALRVNRSVCALFPFS